MGRWKSVDFLCEACNIRENYIEDQDNLEEHKCPHCEGVMKVVPGAPRIMEASYPDGHRRPDSYYIEKEARKVEAKAYDLPVEKRKEVRKDVETIRKDLKK
jgi:Zn-finger nucleic acid-binding protein